MLNRKSSLVYAPLLLVLGATFAFAAPVRVELDGSDGAVGLAVFNYNRSKNSTAIRVACQNLVPGATYYFRVVDPEGAVRGGAMIAGKNGAARNRFIIPGDWTASVPTVYDVGGHVVLDAL